MNILKDALLEDFWIMPATPKYEDSGIPYITSKNIKNDKIVLETANYISQESYDKISKNRPINVGDILISMIGTLGQTAVVKESDCPIYGQNVFLIRLNKEVIDERYFINFFKSKSVKEQLEGKQNKSTQSYLKAGHIESLYISLPTLEEQKEKANKLDKISRIIELKKDELNKLDELVKSRFIELFGEPRSNTNNYPVFKLKETCKVITGNTPPRSNKSNYGDYIEWIKTDNIVSELTYPTVAAECLSQEGSKKGRTVCKGSILMACIAGSLNSIGRVCLTDREISFNQQINAIVPIKYNSIFLYVLLMLSKDYLVEGINMALKGILSKSKLEDKKFFLPPIELQNQFAELVETVDKSKFIVQQSLDKYQQLFDSLMQEYFG